MQIITNEKRIARGSRLGKIGTIVGLGFLTAGLIISLTLTEGPLVWLSFVCLLLGLLFSTVGTMNMNRWVKQPRADEALALSLKGFDDRYRLYNYFLPAPHVLLSPTGLHVITALGHDGVIRYDEGRFHRNFSLGRAVRFMAEEGLGKPFATAEEQAESLRRFLAAGNTGQEVDIQNVLVFYNPKAELLATDPPLPMVNAKGLKKAVRRQPGKTLSSGQYQELQALFDGEVASSQ